jgi:two-component system sensor histidine kinase BaeS
MSFSIKYKILATLFAATVVAVGGMWLLVTWSFDRGLMRYVSSLEQEVNTNFARLLAEEYKRSGSWEPLRQDRHRWHELHFRSFLEVDIPRYARRYAVEPPRQFLEREFQGKPLLAPGAAPRWAPARGVPRYRTVLLDENREIVVQTPLPPGLPPGAVGAEPLEYQPVTVEGRTVGYLGIQKPISFTEVHERRFFERQAHAFMMIALGMMALSAIVALPLSQRLVKPLRALSDATRRLAAGEYSTRIEPQSRDEVGQLARDFNTLAHTLEANEKSRRQWIADISHELRTPLAVLRGEIEALQDGVRPVTPERLAALHEETMRITRLVSDLYELSLSDIGALSYQKRQIDLRDLLQRSVDGWRGRFAEKGLELELDAPTRATVLGDPERLQQLFDNLLSNALRYTDAPGRAWVALGLHGDRAVLDVEDTAPGVEDVHLPHLFERLYRVEGSRSRATGGAGLGLAIARNIVEAHGGTITAAPSARGGLHVRVELPLDA